MKNIIYILVSVILISCLSKTALKDKFKIASLDFMIVDFIKGETGNPASICKFDIKNNNEYVGLYVKLNKVYCIDEKKPLHPSVFDSSVEPGIGGTYDTLTDLKVMIDSRDITNNFTGVESLSVKYTQTHCYDCNPYDSSTNFKVNNLRFEDVFLRNKDSFSCKVPYLQNIDSFCSRIQKHYITGVLDYRCPIFFIMNKRRFVKLISQRGNELTISLKINNQVHRLKISL